MNHPAILPSKSQLIARMFAPESIAIVGASSKGTGWGASLAQGLFESGWRGTRALVNGSGGVQDGVTYYRTVVEAARILGPIDVAILVVPNRHFERAVEDAIEAGTRVLVGITANLDESTLLRVKQNVERNGAILLGPNCMGYADTTSLLELASRTIWPFSPMPGGVDVYSQSGNIGLEVSRGLVDAGVGVRRFVSLGNQLNLSLADFVEELAANDEPGRAVVAYVEHFTETARLRMATRQLVEQGGHFLFVASGATEAASRAARSHTDSMLSSDTILEAFCLDTGAIRFQTTADMIDAALLLRSHPGGGRDGRRRVGIIADGGGHGVLAAGLLERAGFDVVSLSAPTRTALSSIVPAHGSVANPIDLAGAGVGSSAAHSTVLDILRDSGEVDLAVLTGFFGQVATTYGRGTARALEIDDQSISNVLAWHRTHAGIPVLVHTALGINDRLAAARREGLPVFDRLNAAVAALRAVTMRDWPDPATAQAEVKPLDPSTMAAGADGWLNYFDSRAVVAQAGITFPRVWEIAGDTDLADFERENAEGPFVVKSTAGLHKAASGGVFLGVEPGEGLRALVTRLLAESDAAVAIEDLVSNPGRIEFIVGLTRQPGAGDMLLVGAGGSRVEAMADTCTLFLPVSANRIETALLSTTIGRFLSGREPDRLAALAGFAADLGAAFAVSPGIEEIEINPVIIVEEGPTALDARVRISRSDL